MNDKLNMIHVDMDAFYASVEQLDNPELEGKAVIIGGVGLDNRGVVSTASYEARKFGVHSAMPIAKAKKLCPHGIYLPGRGARYSELSKQIFNILLKFTPEVEKISIDEAYLYVKGCHRLYGSSAQIAKKIKEKVNEETGLVCSVGVARNKFLAKIASDLDKPDGLVVIENDEIDKVLDVLSIKKIPGVGEKTANKLNEIGIYKIKQLKRLAIEELIKLFGKHGKQLYELIRGRDDRKVNTNSQTKSISNETTFRNDIIEMELLLKHLSQLCQKVTRRIRKKQLIGNTVFIKVKDNKFNIKTKRITVQHYIDSTEDLYQLSKQLLQQVKIKIPIRLIGVGISGLKEKEKEQMSLFESSDNKEKFNLAIDSIKDKFGNKSIRRARDLLEKENNK
ncbi:MAG TPA: DNA polymerase IV [Halanaerobiales bacterium]|nr:DNA polymerase IV [Halanaerobiales bacterium]